MLILHGRSVPRFPGVVQRRVQMRCTKRIYVEFRSHGNRDGISRGKATSMLAGGRIEDSYRRRQVGLPCRRVLRLFASKVLAEAVFCLGAAPGSLAG